MRPLLKWLKLDRTDQLLLLQALLFLFVARLSPRLVSFNRVPSFLARIAEFFPATLSNTPQSRERIAWAVTRVADHIPGRATCLIQALVTYQLLKRNGLPAELCIGVAKSNGRDLTAHAWVESNGCVIFGGTGATIEQYRQLPKLDTLLS